MGQTKNAERAGGRTKQSQEDSWSNVRTRFERFKKERPDDEFASLLYYLRGLDLGRWTHPNRFYRERDVVSGFAQNLMAGFGATPDDPLLYPDVAGRAYSVRAIPAVRYLMGLVKAETEAVVELGSGWSHNLFQMYVGLGRTRSATLDYIGAEYTDSGRETARAMAGFDGRIKYQDYPMDYRAPDVSFLKKYKQHILVFTHHSIEQVQDISPDLYEQLHALPARVTLVHAEPVGWQRDKALREARKQGKASRFKAVGKAYTDKVKTEHDQIENAAWWSWRLDYNRNLMDIMEDNVARKRFSMVYEAFDYMGAANVLNPPSLFHLEKQA